MQITKVIQGKRDRERVNIHADGAFIVAVDKSTLLKFNLFVGQEISEEDLESILHKDLVSFLVRKMTQWYFRRPRSEKEMRVKMKGLIEKRLSQVELKVNRETIIDQAISRLRTRQCDDKHFAEWFVRERAKQAKYGKKRVMNELLQKGVKGELIENILEEEFTTQDETRAKVLEKRYGVTSLSDITDFKKREKAYRFLKSRGF